MAKTIHALNTASGVVAVVPAIYLKLPGLKEYLVEVPAGTKSYESEKYKSQTAEEYLEDHKKTPAAKVEVTKPASEE